MRYIYLALCTLVAFVASSTAQITIALNNSGQQSFAFDATNHFLFAAQNDSTNHNLNVINTLTNTVIGSTSYSGGFSSEIAYSGGTVYWADQGNSLVRRFTISGLGVPSASSNDSANLATGMAALPNSYAVSKQGTG